MHDLAWRKSSFSSSNGGSCVDLAPLPGGDVALRDSKHPESGHLVFTRAELAAWIAGAKAGEFDDLARPLDDGSAQSSNTSATVTRTSTSRPV